MSKNIPKMTLPSPSEATSDGDHAVFLQHLANQIIAGHYTVQSASGTDGKTESTMTYNIAATDPEAPAAHHGLFDLEEEDENFEEEDDA
jgi:hypothetical protein